MQSTRTTKTSLAIAAIAALTLAGCQGTNSSTTSASASPTPGAYFTGQALPKNVDKLNGTPFYSTSVELATKIQIDGAPFLLIAPQDPSQALLVVETASSPTDLAKRASDLSEFTGTTEVLDAPELKAYVQEQYQLNLKTDEAGKVLLLRVAGASANSAQPGTATATPGPGGATPSSSGVGL